jgi:uncharacterized protein (DUF488 family)
MAQQGITAVDVARAGKHFGMRAVATIGVYGFDVDAFLAALRAADVGLLLDVRQRRGLRGREYAWANAKRLEAALADAGIEYAHHPELGTGSELRAVQRRFDELHGVGQRSRTELAPEFRERYLHEVLDRVDLGPIVEAMPADSTTALMCVESDPEACHRSLLAERMAARHGVSVTHIRP